ncbi:MAG: DUF4037 domain-containing protein [Candidatus Bathyarchaeia archaeon]
MVGLKGENRIEVFRKAAEQLVSRISSFDGVVGIVFLGGLVRGFADRFSDLDVTVFLGDADEGLVRRVRGVVSEVEKRFGVETDVMVHVLSEFRRWRWDEADRWELSRAEIVYDPKGEVKRIFEDKLRLPKDLWTKRIAVCAEYLRWCACPPREGVGTVAESWIERGDLASAHYCLDYALELLIRLVYALNKEFLAPPKWRIHYAYRLKWLPKDYEKLVKEAMTVKSLSVKEFNRRLEAIRKLWSNITPKIKEVTGLEKEQLSKYYVEKVLKQTSVLSNH